VSSLFEVDDNHDNDFSADTVPGYCRTAIPAIITRRSRDLSAVH
jgi:hypothetical protein